MGQGPKVKAEVKREIALIWKGVPGVRDGIRKGPGILKALGELHKQDKPPARLPGLRSVEKLIHEFVEKEKAAAKEASNPDRTWNLAAAANCTWNASPEANKTLLAIWKWCKVVGLPFTVRQAKWVAILRGTVEYKYLLDTAQDYAAREWACEMLDQTFDTSDLDGRLMFHGWEHDAAVSVGAIPKGPIIYDDIGRLMHEYKKHPDVFPMQTPDVWLEEYLISDDLYELKTKEREAYRANLKEIQNKKLELDEGVVYALWLRKISATSIWPTLSIDRRLQIFDQLRQSVREGIQTQKEELRRTPFIQRWKPTKILKGFGLVS